MSAHTPIRVEPEAGGPPPYGMQPGYPTAQPGYPQPVMAQPMVQQQTNTTVVVNQPAPVVVQQAMRDWSTGLCGCFEDCYSRKRMCTASLENPHVRKHFILYLY